MQITTEIKWVPVGEKLPDDELNVLVAQEDGAVDCGYIENGQWFFVNGMTNKEKVTHWAELPPHPTECHLADPEMAMIARLKSPKVGDRFELASSVGKVCHVAEDLVVLEYTAPCQNDWTTEYTLAQFGTCALRTIAQGAKFIPVP